MAERRTRLKLRPGGRFDPNVIADRLDALREMVGVEPKDVGGALWAKQSPENAARSWYKRTTQKRTPFSLPEIEAAVNYLVAEGARTGRISAKVLPGFPFVDLWVSIAIERGETPRSPTPPRRS